MRKHALRGITRLAQAGLLIAAVSLLAPSATADSLFRTQAGKALEGYDAVAYFTRNEAVKGRKDLSVSWQGTRWLFASAENKAQFQADPQRFAPQFGGYCAWAASQGYKARGDPQEWTLYRGKLYLNYNASIRQRWDADKARLVQEAERNWPNI